ncbi:hypothetical protein [Pseudoalteromonas byunsanensis]|uniref:Uncharacterized protein n=1 Tax=Pseudoalteromonas byunsanensis TaxID=327939 RepID=A0A1S1N398_9GAMM|nr:hypothetical protein [Pseudoalteromonas byunsanensis]OHU93793.1 hypothetical protein BIW53_16180 [Pseudoalteromonas byunsanensis]
MVTKFHRHTFSFEGGEQLTTIGATFLVSYLYHRYIDSEHDNWTKIKTKESRISVIRRNEHHHKTWLRHIENMKAANLNRNTLGLHGPEILEMTKAIKECLG